MSFKKPKKKPKGHVSLKSINKECLQIIDKHRRTERRTIVVDYDGTLIDSMNRMTIFVTLLREAHKMGYFIFVVSERQPYYWQKIFDRLKKNKVPFTSIFTSTYYDEHPVFKIDIRKRISLVDPFGLNQYSKTLDLIQMDQCSSIVFRSTIVLCIGDSWLDLLGSLNCMGIKIPSEFDPGVYLYTKNKKIIIL